MIVFLYGQDSYRLRQKLNEIIAEYKSKHKSGLNLRFFDCQEQKITLEDLKEKMQQVSMFKEKKMAIIKNLFSDKVLKEKFLEQGKFFIDSDNVIIICEDGEIRVNDSLLKFLEKNSKTQKFDPLSPAQLDAWLKKQIEAKKIRIEPMARDMLLNYAGDDLWRLSNELDKLANFKKDKDIIVKDVNLMVRPKIETDIFKTIDALAQKDKKLALNLLRKHLKNGDSPIYLLSMINFQFRNLLIVRDLIERKNSYTAIAKKSGLHPFVAQKSYYQAARFTLSELKKIYQKIFQVDCDIKTGKIDQEIALDFLVASI